MMLKTLAETVDAIRAGDPEALAHLYDRTASLVFGVAKRILRRREDAEEVTLDVYSQVWRTAATFDSSRASVEGWLVMMARARAIDRIRALSARPDIDSTSLEHARSATWSAMLVGAREARHLIARALTTVTPSDRTLLELAFFEGYTHSELASRLNLPLGTVKTRLRTALRKMRGEIERGPKSTSGSGRLGIAPPGLTVLVTE